MSENGQVPAKEKPWQELEEDRRQADATGLGLKVTHDGKVYQFHFGELCGLDALELRRQAGYTTSELFRTASQGFADVDTVAVIVWLSRRLAGDVVPFETVARAVKWQARMVVDLADPVPVAPATVSDAATGEADRPQA